MAKTPRSAVAGGMEESPTHPSNNMTCRHYCPICMLYFRTALETRCCGNTICEGCATSLVKRSAGHSAVLHTLIEVTTPQRGSQNEREAAAGADEGIANTHARQSLLTPVRARSSASRSHGGPFVRQSILHNAQAVPAVQSITPCPYCQRSLKVRVLADQVSSRSYKDSPVVERYASTDISCVSDVSVGVDCRPQQAREPSNESTHSAESNEGVYSLTISSFRRGGLLRSSNNYSTGTAAPSPVKTGDSFEALRRKLVPLPSSTAAPQVPAVTTIGLPPLHPPTAHSVATTATRQSDQQRRLPDVHGRSDSAADDDTSISNRGRARRTFSNLQAPPRNRGQSSLPAVKPREASPPSSSWCPIM